MTPLAGSLVLLAGALGCDREAANSCGSDGQDLAGPPVELPILIQPTRHCRAPHEDEPAGDGPEGQVCTWQAVAGATEPGRVFADYADCGVVRTQRPYYPMPSADVYPQGDPRLEEVEYASELQWVQAQIRATGCACCHSDVAPAGPVRWTVDAPGNWMGTFSDRDVAALAGLIDTSMFGRFPPEDNNGFHRVDSVPSTDPDRMRSFFADELHHRGRLPEEFDDAPPTGAILLEQQAYEVEPCACGEGVGHDGTIEWSGGEARYLYVMEAGAANPTIPPNLDLPEGTIWRVDVPHDGTPLESGAVEFGVVPEGAAQDWPHAGAPASLEPGQEYTLYVTRDVAQPITRCTFIAQ
ncbi:hypothetical protein [Plesiocystis pacifica]|uniref:hypothetical protein n=1 Tax=Plesiocystis pacifica TaxID=191768 RepID=UPI0012F95C7B|nr:hypothetical protein [Plesiocystis pacifica]